MFKSVTKTSQYEVGEYNDSLWLKVFFHNHSTKVNFIDEAEARHCNSEFKYSILDEISPRMKIKNKYEFIMEFPNDNTFIRWHQNRNPVKELDGKDKADGFEMLDKNINSELQSFRGLTRSTIKYNNVYNCFLDGNPSSGFWYYAIGMYENSSESFKTNGIPTYKAYTESLRLWIKLSFKDRFNKCTINYNVRIYYCSILFLCLLLSS